MRDVKFVANGKEYKTYAEARKTSKFVETVLTNNYEPDYVRGYGQNRIFGTYTGKLADGWKSPGQRI